MDVYDLCAPELKAILDVHRAEAEAISQYEIKNRHLTVKGRNAGERYIAAGFGVSLHMIYVRLSLFFFLIVKDADGDATMADAAGEPRPPRAFHVSSSFASLSLDIALIHHVDTYSCHWSMWLVRTLRHHYSPRPHS